ncbi:MAG: nickel/cobalt transporter [Beijerinckiaceae bacterium]|jgi:nickel/cobalt transporter (NicO) family protein|nr:nickel/cobalt transporter [Beijerinckiaceae bacterium]
MRRFGLFLLAAAALLMLALHAPEAGAQARNPFSVGISEGGGASSGVTGYILAQQQKFDLLMRNAVRAIRADPAAIWTLMSLAFAYGVFHAAGPGHGKAVLAAYLVANERALKRGLVLAGLAALLQALVALAIVGGLTMIIGATSQTMRSSARYVEIASYAAIVALGLALVWRKGAALFEALRAPRLQPVGAAVASRFQCVAADDPAHVHGADCGHIHMLDPSQLGAGFSWKSAAATVFAAGLRPCSGAILVLVFSAAQGIFWAGVGATLAMALGTAATTGALAVVAVYAKGLAVRLSGGRGVAGAQLVRGLELAAALAVLLLGLGLLTGTLAGGAL